MGLRESESFCIAVDDIDFDFDFEERVIRVRRQIKKIGSRLVFALPKGDKTRVVPLNDYTAEILRRHIEAHLPTPCTLPWKKPDGPPATFPILFRRIDCGPVKSRNYSEVFWKPALVADPRSER